MKSAASAKFDCNFCERKYVRKYQLRKHLKKWHPEEYSRCETDFIIRRRTDACQPSAQVLCNVCGENFPVVASDFT